MDPPPLSAQKSTFLTTQIRLLSAPLQPSRHFTTTHLDSDSDSHNPIPSLTPTQIADVVAKLNDKIKAHVRLVFPAQTQRHILEQIESLYWEEVGREVEHDDRDNDREREEGDGVVLAVERDINLTETQAIDGLPEGLRDAFLNNSILDGNVAEDLADEYHTLLNRLSTLAHQRDEARRKLERYRKLQELLKPFENAGESVQGNLVAKDGEMRREMERMRVLVARVVGRLGNGDGGLEGEGGVDAMKERGKENVDMGFDERLKGVMELT